MLSAIGDLNRTGSKKIMSENAPTYHIRVKGILTPTMVGWLENITVIPTEPTLDRYSVPSTGLEKTLP
jgi:hypothetical protein